MNMYIFGAAVLWMVYTMLFVGDGGSRPGIAWGCFVVTLGLFGIAAVSP